MKEIYISIDVETDGPIPGEYSMLSLGAAAFDESGMIDTFDVRIRPISAAGHPDTMAWWKTQPAAWAEATRDQQDPGDAMRAFMAWVKKLPGNPVIVGFPVTFDFMFLYWYAVKYVGYPAPFGFQGLDIKTLAMDRLGLPFKHSTKRNFPRRWFDGSPKHTHTALDDAIGQGVIFRNIMKDKK